MLYVFKPESTSPIYWILEEAARMFGCSFRCLAQRGVSIPSEFAGVNYKLLMLHFVARYVLIFFVGPCSWINRGGDPKGGLNLETMYSGQKLILDRMATGSIGNSFHKKHAYRSRPTKSLWSFEGSSGRRRQICAEGVFDNAATRRDYRTPAVLESLSSRIS